MSYDSSSSSSNVANTEISSSSARTVSTTDDFKALNFIPEVFHTDKLRNFFDGTVEQVFSKANAEKTTEYIGRKYDTYYRSSKDNYKIETNKNRSNYQLETAVVIRDSDSKLINDAIFYNEMIDYVSTENGKVNDQKRLFSQDYYSYGQPIDHDKFLNYENYYWYPSFDLGYTATNVAGKIDSVTATSGGQTEFTLTYPFNSNVSEVKLNNVVTTAFTSLGKTITMNSPTNLGDILTVTHKIDPDEILGRKNFVSPNGVTLSSGMLIEFNSTYFTTSNANYSAGVRYYVEGVGTTNGIQLIAEESESELFLGDAQLEWDKGDYPNWVNSSTAPDNIDAWDMNRWDVIPDVATPDYMTIQRGSRDKNPWSRTNGWIHKDVVSDGFQVSNTRKGKRPIIEFQKDIELYNYGQNHVRTVDVLAETQTVSQIHNQTNVVVDGIALQTNMLILFKNKNYDFSLVPWDGATPWDHDVDNDPATGGGGGTGGDSGWDITGVDFDESSSIWKATVSSGGVCTLAKLTASEPSFRITTNDKVTVRLGEVNQGKEYYWNGYDWILSQGKNKVNIAPLFNLYDRNGKRLDDATEYPSSTFIGNKLFNYTVGTGTNDTILGFPVTYDRFTGIGEIKFKNYINDENATHGFTFYKQFDHPVLIKKNIDKKVIVQKDSVQTGNRYYIDDIEQQNLVLIRNNTYEFNLDDTSLVATGYTNHNHPMQFSTTSDGTHNSGSAYSTGIKYFLDGDEVSATVFIGAKFATASKRRIEFTPTSSTPNNLFYYCPNHTGMGSKVFVEDNAVSSLADASEMKYEHHWKKPERKSTQYLRQEFQVTETSSANTFILESINANDDKVRVFVNNKETEKDVDYKIEDNQKIVMTNDLESGSYVIVTWNTYEIKNLKSAYYVPPKNLSHNPANEDITDHSYSDLLNHFSENISTQVGLSGLPLGNNTYRDTKRDLTLGDSILQHSAPMMKYAMHINYDENSLIKGLRKAQDDYVRFKNKFLGKVQEVVDTNETSSWTDAYLVDYVMKEINKNKKITDNWAYSLMASYGDTKNNANVTITANNKTWSSASVNATQSYQRTMSTAGQPGLTITGYTYDPLTEKDTKSFYIYVNGTQLIMNVDYVIDNEGETKIIFTGDNKPDLNDKISVHFFPDKQPAWIPATPSKLGMMPVYLPGEFEDKEYTAGTQTFIQGHDGSVVPKYNDDRDRALLELEKRIYNDIENRFIDPDYVPPITYDSLVGNYFNSKEYSYKEYTDVIKPHVYRWATINDVDWSKNNGYSSTDWKTWNWSSVTDISGTNAPGHWRGLYKKIYGTDRPHTHPWEMLGFTAKPWWWDNTYSWTEATKRAALIADIEKGIIRDGDRQNSLKSKWAEFGNVYRRDGFSSYVPVDTNGRIIDPVTIGICPANPGSREAQKPWKISDNAPAERAYMMNSTYGFGATTSFSLMKPAEFYSLMFDTLNLQKNVINNDVVYDIATGVRHNNNVYVHRETKGNVIVSGTGYNQYVSERLIADNMDVARLYGGRLRNLTPQLAHKQGSFIDYDQYKAQAESYAPGSNTTTIFLPKDNVNSRLHTSPATTNTAYSAVIVEKTLSGYKVSGYNINKNYFRAKVSLTSGPSYPVRVGGKAINVPVYGPNQSLSVGQYVSYQGAVYKTVVEHTSTEQFVARNFVTANKVPTEGGAEVTYYSLTDGDNTVDIEYGHEFDTAQEVFDFLVNYGRQLESEGWQFDEYNTDTSEDNDWLYAAKEFLFWSIGGWGVGNIIALSPSADKIKFRPPQGVVANVEDVVGNSWSILNKNGLPIDPNDTEVYRKQNTIIIKHLKKIPMYFVNLYTREIEHITVFDNKTLFDDVIYDPILSIRQPRIKQTVLRAKNWTGKYEANGFLISEANGMITNFETSTEDVSNFLDVDKAISNENLKKASLRSIGYTNRPYLENLQIVDENQSKFYQGMVRQKGTKNSIDRLARTDVISQRESLDLYEYYAFKMGEFGGSDINQSIEFKIDPVKVKTNPQLIQLVSNVDKNVTTDDLNDNIITIDVDDAETWLKKPHGDKNTNSLFATRTESFELPTAGYVHDGDTTYRVFDKTALNQHYQNNSNVGVALGSTYWLAKDSNLDWNVYRLSNLTQTIDSVSTISPLKVTLNEPTKLLTTHGTTAEVVIPKYQNSNADVITMTHGSKLLELDLSDQSVTKVVDASSIVGSNAEIIADELSDQVAQFYVTAGGSGYSNNDTVEVSGSGGSGGVGTVVIGSEIDTLSLATGGTGHTTSSKIQTRHSNSSMIDIGTVTSVHDEITAIGLSSGGTGYSSGEYIVTGNYDNNPSNANVTYFVIGQISSVGGSGEITGITPLGLPRNIGTVLTDNGVNHLNDVGTNVKTKVVVPALNALSAGTSADITRTDAIGIADAINLTANVALGSQTVTQALANVITTSPSTSTATFTGTGTDGIITGVTLTSGGGGFYGEPSDITIKTGSTDSSGSGAVIRVKGNGPSYRVPGVLTDINQNFTAGETITTVGGKSAKVAFSYQHPGSTNVELYLYNNSAGVGTGDNWIGSTSTASLSSVRSTPSVFTPYNITGSSTDNYNSSFGGILTFKVNKGGSNYHAATMELSGDPSSKAAGSLDVTGGAITAAYVTTPGYGYRKELSTNVDVTISIKDTITLSDNVLIDFNDQLIKTDSISNVAITVNSAFDASVGPQFDLGTSGTPAQFVSGQALTSNATISTLSDVTDRSNVALKLRFYGTALSSGNASVTVNYKKAMYNVKEVDSSNTAATAQNTTYFASGTHPIYQYKDIRLASRNNGLDSANVQSSFVDTVNDFVSNVCSTITFSDNDRIWIDNGGDNNWYTLKQISDNALKIKYDNLAVNANVPSSVQIGSKYWIVDSEVDYTESAPDSKIFLETLRSNRHSKQIDSELFIQSKLVDLDDQSRETPFEIFDPIKNQIPGIAQKELKYISQIDPAIYTNHSDTNRVSTLTPWADDHVGEVWWNTSTLRYYEYENFDIQYRKSYWSMLFPGSTVDIYEWVERTELPASYTGDGSVVNTTDYTTVTKVDKQGFSSSKYYYWVKNRTSKPDYDWRNLTTTAIARIIKSPTNYGINWHAPISDNTLLIANSTQNISDNTAFNLNYKTKHSEKLTHKQWKMVKENDPDVLIDKRIWNKLTDSISGKDATGLSVPDTSTLSVTERYGNKIRPRQSWFKDVKEARRVFAYKANEILANINLDINYPEWNKGVSTSPTIFDKSDYFITGYDNRIVINKTVDLLTDVDTTTLSENDVIKVNLDHNNKWGIYIYGDREKILSANVPVSTGSSTSDLQDATTSGGSYSSGGGGAGYQGIQSYHSSSSSSSESSSFELIRIASEKSTYKFNSTFSTADDVADDTRALVSNMYNYLFTGERKINLNKLLFAMVNYVFTEQSDIDWVIKTSYIDVVQKESSLQQIINYQPDTFAYVKDYVNEVKPYHSKLVNYLSKKQTTIENANVKANASIQVKNKLVFDRVTSNIELLDPTTSNAVVQLTELKTKRTTANITADGLPGDLSHTTENDNPANKNTAADRIAKYFYGSTLESINIPNAITTAVKFITTTNLATTYNNGTNGVGATLTANAVGVLSFDGVAVGLNDRILVKNQNTQLQNGVYKVTTLGTGSVNYVLTRTTDFDSTAEIKTKTLVPHDRGALESKSYLTQNTGNVTIGTDAISFGEFDPVQSEKFMSDLKNKIAPFRNMELDGMAFTFDDLINSETVEDLGIDIIGFDTVLSWDTDAKQNWYDNNFYSAKDWKSGLTYYPSISVDKDDNTTNQNLVKHADLSHFNAWATGNNYEVGALATYEGKLYRCNVKHNAVDSTASLDNSKWDLINDYVYLAREQHLSSSSFESDYDAGKWLLLTTTFDGSGFVRPQQRDIPEELIPTKAKETLRMTVITNEYVDTDTISISGITQANPLVITTSNPHYIENGDRIKITGVVGMTEVNNKNYVAANVTTNTLQLKHTASDTNSINGTTFSAYTSGGTITNIAGIGDQYAYRIFYNAQGNASYKRLPKAFETTLTSAVDGNSNKIELANAQVVYGTVSVPDPDNNSQTLTTVSAITISDKNPGYIWIGEELIEFREVDGNTLRKIRRGANGTSIRDHANGSTVNSATSQHDIPNASQSAFWSAQDSAGTKLATDPTLDTTEQATFIRLGGNSNFALFDTTYVEPDFVENQEDYFGEE